MSLRKKLFYLREYFFPVGCGGCGEALLFPEYAYYGLCEKCRELFFSVLTSEKRCKICGKPLITEKESCLACRDENGEAKTIYNERIVNLKTLFPYSGKFREILGSFKFKKSIGIGNFLVYCLNNAIENLEDEVPRNAVWVPVPPRPGKLKKQGWDQIEYLAALLKRDSRQTGIPVKRCLKRLPSRSQKELNREERGTNLEGRIRCIRQPPKTAILFDDIMTTGATLNACAAALLEGGAKKVYGICLFYD